MATRLPDCRTCGVCCVAPRDEEAYCDVTEEDLKKLNRSWVRRNVLFSGSFDALVSAVSGRRLSWGAIRTKWRRMTSGPLKGYEACTCVALKGALLDKVRCSIYDRRPRTCRVAVEPGDRVCLELRRAFLEGPDALA